MDRLLLDGFRPKLHRNLQICCKDYIPDFICLVPRVFELSCSQKDIIPKMRFSGCGKSAKIYRMPTQVPYHPFNYRMAAAIFIRVVSRYDKVTMRYWMKPLTAPPGGKWWS
ncbi:hypothetical protein AVEN_135116-1 [Araneus ventricosus]|uniref:Uncharacterized protein n=1 Tax=Araneus ventricosus TaxID=182803 RepID=A0A4Y2B409_ARAVE|nr:hypothetical protein AVEN_135116-1 [Araneus ventricosus]